MSAMATLSVASVQRVPTPVTRRAGARRAAPVVCRAAPRDAAKLSAGILAVTAANAARADEASEASEAPAAEAAAQAADAVADATAQASAAADAAAAQAADAAAQAADAASKAAAQASEALNGALGGLSGGLGGLTSQAGGALEGLKGGLGGVTSQAGGAIGGITSKAGGAIGGLGSQAAGTLGGAAKGVGSVAGPALSGAAKVAGEGAGVVGQGLGQASKAVGGATSAVTGAVGGATSAVTGAVGGATSAVNSTVTSTVQSIEAALPPEFQDVVAKAQTDSDTAVALIGLAAALPIGLVVLGAATRGYAGDKNPFVVEEQLKKNRKAFIIDTRSEDARRNDGVPDLRGKARGKGASVEVVTLPPDERRVLSNPRAVELELAATKVKALTKNGASVYVLGPDAKDLAKAITGLGGRRAFVVAGGFDAWRSSGLKVGSKYAKNALEGLGEDTSEAASSFTQKVAGSVKTSITSKKPTDALVPFVGLVAVVAAVVNYKTALEYAGVIGIELTILAKLLSYESPWAFFEDVKDVAGGFAGAVGSFEPPSVPEVSVPKVSMPKVAEMAPPPPAPVKEEAVVEEAVVEEAVEEEEVAEPEPEAAAPEPEAAAPAPAEEKKAGRVYDESYAESKADMAKVAEEAERLADANDQGKRDM